MICYLYPEPVFYFFASSVPELLYYSHIPTAILTLLIGFYVFFSNRHALLNKLFLTLSLCFFTWIFISLIAWTNINGDVIAFLWPFFGVSAGLISILSIYFIYVFLNKNDIPFSYKIIFMSLLVPLLLLAPTNISISGFDITNCDAFIFEGITYKIYYTLLGVLAMIWIFVLLVKSYRNANPIFRKQIIYIGIGIESFLLLFFSIVFLVTYLVNLGILADSRLEMYGLFGILAFIVSVAFSIVRYKAFKVNIAAPIALVCSLWLLVFSLLFLQNIDVIQFVVSVTLLFLLIFGFQLIRSVKREIQHREEIEKLVKKLKRTNDRLKILDKQKSEFVSIASHQLRSPLAAISGYASLLQDGNFGKLPTKASESVQRIYSSARAMSQSIEEYLNVSQIESGNMKYNMTDFNLVNLLENICDDLRSVALKKGVLLFSRTDLTRSPIVHADQGKVTQALHNLINNSIKYTEKGTVTAYVHDNLSQKKIFIEILDTGIGMSAETLEIIFQKFERADNAHVASVQGTGLGLYMALKIIEAMGGTINAYSDGEGKGSRFVVELPLVG